MQQSNVDAEWKPEFLFTAIFGETNQVKCEQLPGRIKEFKPETSKFFSTNKGKKIISTYLFFCNNLPIPRFTNVFRITRAYILHICFRWQKQMKLKGKKDEAPVHTQNILIASNTQRRRPTSSI